MGYEGTVGVGLDGRLQLGFDELREAAKEAARLGFASAWTPAAGLPDAFHVCGQWATATDGRLRTGISVVPSPRWTLPTLAAQAATVGMLAGGRFTLGIGTGGYGPSYWEGMGLADRPIGFMREQLVTLRGLLPADGVSLGLAALGPQMLRLAGEASDAALLNWATPEQIAWSRDEVATGAARAGRDAADVPLVMYIRVCVDDDVEAARRAFGTQVLGYAMARPGVPVTVGYRGHFGRMGFDDVLADLEARRDAGESMPALVDAAPDELFSAVGYWGQAAGAAAAFARSAQGLDEALVRVITAKGGLEPVIRTMEAISPAAVAAA